MTKGVVCGQEEPALTAVLNNGLSGNLAECIGVIDIVDAVRGAGLVGQFGTGCACVHGDALLFSAELLHRERIGRTQRQFGAVGARTLDPQRDAFRPGLARQRQQQGQPQGGRHEIQDMIQESKSCHRWLIL